MILTVEGRAVAVGWAVGRGVEVSGADVGAGGASDIVGSTGIAVAVGGSPVATSPEAAGVKVTGGETAGICDAGLVAVGLAVRKGGVELTRQARSDIASKEVRVNK